jgi:hypothetical protein
VNPHLANSSSLRRSKISENFDFRELVIDASSSSKIGPPTAVLILLQFTQKNLRQRVSTPDLKNRLLNGREAAV